MRNTCSVTARHTICAGARSLRSGLVRSTASRSFSFLHRRAEQQRAPPAEPQLEPRQEARAVVVHALLAETDRLHVAEAIEHREGLAVLEHARAVVGARRRRLDVEAARGADDRRRRARRASHGASPSRSRVAAPGARPRRATPSGVAFAVDRRQPDRRPPAPAAVARVSHQLLVDVHVVARHARARNRSSKYSRHARARQLDGALRRRDRLVDGVDDEPRHAVAITSGTEPQRNAITGVPHAIASIMTSPNGSGQSIGNSSAAAPPRNVVLLASPISPTNSMRGSVEQRLDLRLVVLLIVLVDLGGDLQRHAQRAARSRSRDRGASRARCAQKRQVAARARLRGRYSSRGSP